MWKYKGHVQCKKKTKKTNLKINIKVGGSILPDFKKYSTTMLIKIAYC